MKRHLIKQIRTGKVREMGEEGAKDPLDRPWKSGMFKCEREGKVWLGKTGLASDEVGDPIAHGGEEKALFAYPEEHYDYWEDQIEAEIKSGGMGENLVINGASEKDICIGDTYEVGDAVIQVSQPRQPCWKPARRYRVMDLALQIQRSGLTGWYYRVIKEGHIEAGIVPVLIDRPFPEWTIAMCNQVMHEKKDDLELSKRLADCPLLAPNWQRRLNKRLKGNESKIEARVYGPNKEK